MLYVPGTVVSVTPNFARLSLSACACWAFVSTHHRPSVVTVSFYRLYSLAPLCVSYSLCRFIPWVRFHPARRSQRNSFKCLSLVCVLCLPHDPSVCIVSRRGCSESPSCISRTPFSCAHSHIVYIHSVRVWLSVTLCFVDHHDRFALHISFVICASSLHCTPACACSPASSYDL